MGMRSAREGRSASRCTGRGEHSKRLTRSSATTRRAASARGLQLPGRVTPCLRLQVLPGRQPTVENRA
eukprot:scaffold106095_cov63-Phaeocystis_antarctica.AAC.3